MPPTHGTPVPAQDTQPSPPIHGLHYIRCPVEVVGPTSATVATAAAAQCDPRLRVIAIQAALSPFLQSADDLGLGPTIVASVEASPAMRAVAAQTQEAEPLASLEALLEYIPDAIATGVKADMLLAHCTQTRHTVATEGNPQSDPLHKWCRQLGALWEAANQALNLQLGLVTVPKVARKPPTALLNLQGQLGDAGFPSHIVAVANLDQGGIIDTHHWILVVGTQAVMQHWHKPTRVRGGPQDMRQILMRNQRDVPFILTNRFDIRSAPAPSRLEGDPNDFPRQLHWIRERGTETWFPVYDPEFPGPPLSDDDDDGPFGPATIGISTITPLFQEGFRALTMSEVMEGLGFDEGRYERAQRIAGDELTERLPSTMGIPVARAWLAAANAAFKAARRLTKPARVRAFASIPRKAWPEPHQDSPQPIIATGFRLDTWTTIPLPSETAWNEAVASDPDLQRIVQSLDGAQPLSKPQLHNPGYWAPLQNNLLVAEDGCLFKFEQPRHLHVRQLRTRVVPVQLRRVVFAACHSSPLSGHVGVYKTFWRIAIRFWWPGMTEDIRIWVIGCAHCRLANSSDFAASSWLHSYSAEAVFDVVFLDVWMPGSFPSKFGNIKFLCCLEEITGFADGAPLKKRTPRKLPGPRSRDFSCPTDSPASSSSTKAAHSKDTSSECAACWKIPCTAVSASNHRANRVERYFRLPEQG